MSIEQAIRERWLSCAGLVAMAPIERFYTGFAPPGVDSPYVVLARVREDDAGATSSGSRLWRVRLRFTVWGDDLESGKSIVREMRRRFDRAEFAFDGGAVLNMQRDQGMESSQPDGTWELVEEYVAVVEG